LQIPEGSSLQAGTPTVAGLSFPRLDHIEVTPISGACGCEIAGVDLREPLSPEVLAEIMRAFEQFTVIVFRNQDLTPEQHKAFSRYFGELTELPQAPTYADHADMQEVRREADEPENVVPSFEHFHTDSPFLPQPPKCIVMHALEVPAFGGDTAFSNAYLVYENLSDGMKELLDGLEVVYSGRKIWSNNEKLPPERRFACAKAIPLPRISSRAFTRPSGCTRAPGARRFSSPAPISSTSSAGARPRAGPCSTISRAWRSTCTITAG
jgi:taurine dioxygenase